MMLRQTIRLLLLGVAAASMSAQAVLATSLLYVTDDVPSVLDIDGGSSSTPGSQAGIVNLLEPLVYFRRLDMQDGIQRYDYTQFEGRLAESWSYDPATLTWTFNLRHGVTGCNGATFNADDVIYNLARAKSVSGAASIAWFPANLAGIAGFTSAVFGNTPEALRARVLLDTEVRKIDDYTVTIRQERPSPLMLASLSQFSMHLYDKEQMEAHATPQDPWSHDYASNTNAPGFGPYCLERWQKDREFVVVANPNYYRGVPNIERITMRKVAQSSQRMVLVRSGSAQLADRLTPREFASVREDHSVRVVSVPSNATTLLLMNWSVPPWNNVALRRAVALAIPYDSIVKNVYFGQSAVYQGVVPSIFPGHAELDHIRTTDLAQARTSLAEAGFPEGHGLEAFPNAFRLTYASESEGVLGPAATIIQTELRKLGIPVTLNPVPLVQVVDRAVVHRDLEMLLSDFSKSIGIDAAFATQLYYVSRPNGGVANYSLYSNPRLDDLWLNHARAETDPAKRLALLKEIQQIAYDDVAIAPVTENRLQWVMSPKLSGVGFHGEHALKFFDLKLAE